MGIGIQSIRWKAAGLLFFALVGAIGVWAGNRSVSWGYMVAVSRSTTSDPAWDRVVQLLQRKHHAERLVFDRDLTELLPSLQTRHPRYLCVVARPEEVTRRFVAALHRMTRQLDADPYTDCLWGIVTGYSAQNAWALVKETRPLRIRKVLAATEVDLSACVQGRWYSELTPGLWVEKKPDGRILRHRDGPRDTTSVLVDALNRWAPDLFVTSGHATEHDWQIGYAYRNGSFHHAAGRLYGLDTKGNKHWIRSPNPKVYMPVGNCLIGHIDGPDCMATAWLNPQSGGARQMFGYTVPTWYGYAGWGVLDYFLEQPGRFSFAEAFFANQHALIHRLAVYFPELLSQNPTPGRVPQVKIHLSKAARAAGLRAKDAAGLLYDRDTVAFYGDPAWEARMMPGDCFWEQKLTRKGNRWTLRIRPRRGDRSFLPRNTNGSQRGGRPIIAFLPCRIGPARILEGQELHPVVTDDFILVPLPRGKPVHSEYRVVFQAKPVVSMP